VKLRILFCSALMVPLAFAASQGPSGPVSSTAAPEIPHLRKQGTATQLIVDGKPFLALSGELLNNSATSLEYMKPVWPRLVETKLNSVVAGVSWAQIEPQEGKFDFSVPDGVIQEARSHNLRLILIWFASWKNGYSSYPPDWLKKNFERFPRTQIAGGKSIELLSTLSDANRDADARAFAALMRHIKEVDGREHTVVMIQVENEVGVLGDSRDRSPAANKAFEGPVPKELMSYLQSHKDSLIPEFRQVWEAAGFKTSGTWEEVFGPGPGTDEIFMAWNYARYVGRVAEAGKAEYAIPLYTNTWLYGFGRPNQPGRTPSGGPLPHVHDLWRAGAPGIDILSPDLYNDFAPFAALYTRSGNPLFIPEGQAGVEGAARALYAFGRHDAIGYSPFAIDNMAGKDPALAGIYDLLSQLAPLIVKHQGDGTMSAVLLGPNDPPQKVKVGNYTLEATATRPRVAPGAPAPQTSSPSSAAIFIAAGPDEYFAAGSGISVTISPNTPGPPLAGLATVEDGRFVEGRWVAGRRLAGDDDAQGQSLSLRNMGIQRFTVYRYR
jgi:Domain of unknown function (DUF5597)/Beta-galactosidase